MKITEIMVEIDKVKKNLINWEQREQELKEKDFGVVLETLKNLEFVWDKYNIKKVYLYGSLADKSFQKSSDIDIAVEADLPFDEFLKFFAEINGKIDMEVDLKLLKELPFAENIIKDGLLLYERKNSNP